MLLGFYRGRVCNDEMEGGQNELEVGPRKGEEREGVGTESCAICERVGSRG